MDCPFISIGLGLYASSTELYYFRWKEWYFTLLCRSIWNVPLDTRGGGGMDTAQKNANFSEIWSNFPLFHMYFFIQKVKISLKMTKFPRKKMQISQDFGQISRYFLCISLFKKSKFPSK